MEWVETTAKTVEAAKETALDQLGVAEDDAEFEILAEPRAGLFGFMRGEARVRARVRPTQARPKIDRRDRRRRRGGQGGERAPEAAGGANPARDTADRRRPRRRGGAGRERVDTRHEEAPDQAGPGEEDTDVVADLSPMDQADIVAEFLRGLMSAFGLEGSLHQDAVDEETIEVRVDGDDLGILIGPRGQTLQAVQELGRAAVQRRLAGGREARVRVDVAGYRQRRREALERFVQGVADDVRTSGVAKALEAMSPPDRKIVHDTVNALDGVGTMSEGEEPSRRVVIVPVAPPAGGAADAEDDEDTDAADNAEEAEPAAPLTADASDAESSGAPAAAGEVADAS